MPLIPYVQHQKEHAKYASISEKWEGQQHNVMETGTDSIGAQITTAERVTHVKQVRKIGYVRMQV